MIEVNDECRPAAVDSLDKSLEDVLSEQVRDWMRGECKTVKAYLARHESMLQTPDAPLELINQEIILRRRRGDTPRPEDYLTDFPNLAEPLSDLFEVYNAISLPTQVHSPPSFPAGADCDREGVDNNTPSVPGYTIERVLGTGGMGTVYLADDLALKRKVALKLLRRDGLDEPAARSRFEREAAAAARCQHPNLVQIFAVGEHRGQFFLALEYVEGNTLAKNFAGIPQPARRAAEAVEKLARAVDHAHNRGVVHRDLKPANVLVARDGEPKITDFGLARLDDWSTRTEVGALVGTLAYMAPEQVESGSQQIGARTDIHALGAILYELLTGRPPYRGETPQQALHAIASEQVVPPSNRQPGIPRDLEAVCLKCLEKRPSDRYANAADLAGDLRHFLDGRPTLARPLPAVARLWRWSRRNPRLAGLSPHRWWPPCSSSPPPLSSLHTDTIVSFRLKSPELRPRMQSRVAITSKLGPRSKPCSRA